MTFFRGTGWKITSIVLLLRINAMGTESPLAMIRSTVEQVIAVLQAPVTKSTIQRIMEPFLW